MRSWSESGKGNFDTSSPPSANGSNVLNYASRRGKFRFPAIFFSFALRCGRIPLERLGLMNARVS
jgi:hypothetical protein